VENVIDAFKMASNRRIEYNMGIGDYADSTLPLPFGTWRHYEQPSFPVLTILRAAPQARAGEDSLLYELAIPPARSPTPSMNSSFA
jgi:hypothetical protein